jgi:hypothetical protein
VVTQFIANHRYSIFGKEFPEGATGNELMSSSELLENTFEVGEYQYKVAGK